MALRGGWVEDRGGIVSIVLRDRPDEQFWSKTGKPYRAAVIHPGIADHLRGCMKDPESYVVPGHPDHETRLHWFRFAPQRWLKAHGITSQKPLHRLRGAYADAIAALTSDAVAARLAGVKAAQDALGHTSSKTTERHYLSGE
jgi:integrase